MADQTETPLNGYIDHTLLRPDATARDIENFAPKPLSTSYLRCVSVVAGCSMHGIILATQTSPSPQSWASSGASDPDAKRYETEVAVDNGAHEIDMVMNLGKFIDGDHSAVSREIRDVIDAADDRRVKVIIETGFFNDEQIATACKIAVQAEAHFLKTSTGFGPGGATIEHVKLMRETVGQFCGVKASGGIRDAETAKAMIEAGASRIGTSSGVIIVGG